MATQLTRARLRVAFASKQPVLSVSPRYLVAAGAACLVLVYAAFIAASVRARDEESGAERRYADAMALLNAPPASVADLEAKLDSAKASLASLQAQSAPLTIDPASDEATALLVERAQAAGVAVKGVDRAAPGHAKTNHAVYDTQGVRMTIGGTAVQISTFLSRLHATDPALVASLVSMDVTQDGSASAEILFTMYVRAASPTPAAGAKR